VHIKYRISERDYQSAAMLELRKRSTLSTLEYYSPYAFTIVWITASLLASSVDMFLTLGVLPILVGFLYLRRSKLQREYTKLRHLHPLQALDLDGTGLRVVTTLGTSRSSWDVYSKYAEDSKSFILYKADGHGFLPIPKDYLTVTQIDELHTLLEARLPSE
jgi:YcxB-like protein